MKDLISREALMKYPIRIDHYDKENGSLDFVLGGESVLEYAESLPAVDAVEVVRCRDCDVPHNKWTGCPHMNGLIPPADHFCSYGEPKNGN